MVKTLTSSPVCQCGFVVQLLLFQHLFERAGRKVLVPFLCPLVTPSSQMASHRPGPESRSKQPNPLCPGLVYPGICMSTLEPLWEVLASQAALCGWNVPFVPLTISSHFESGLGGMAGDSMGTTEPGLALNLYLCVTPETLASR